MRTTDFLIVGSGLAGTLLALELVKSGSSVTVLSDTTRPSSSKVAGGLFNPVTGKYLAKTWLADELFGGLESYYTAWEQVLGTTFYHRTGLFRPFTGPEHKKSSLAQMLKHDLAPYVEVRPSSGFLNDAFFRAKAEGMFSPAAGWLDVPAFLRAAEAWLQGKAYREDTSFVYEELRLLPEGVQYRNWKAGSVVFCEGYYAHQNPFFNWLPFQPVKGETLIGVVEDYTVNTIVNQGKWLIPLGGNKVRLGATYAWHSLDFLPTEQGRTELLEALGKMIDRPFTLSEQQAGVRPSTRDRRPFLGKHPRHEQLYIFNGLGTKGVSLAPWFAVQLVRNLLHDELIHPEANIKRFYALYS